MTHNSILVNPPRLLNSTERKIVDHLLSVEFPGNIDLLNQVNKILVSEVCKDCLSIGFAIDKSLAKKAITKHRIPIEAEGYDIDGMKIHILLIVDEGYLDELEIYREDLGKIQDILPIEKYNILIFT